MKYCTVDLLEHLPHAFDVIMVQKPSLAILLVLLEWYPKRICDVYRFAIVLAKKDTDHALCGIARHGSCVVVGDGE
jgi:hypothetical protein